MSLQEVKVSSRNSTAAPLAAGGEFVGGVDDLLSFEELDINVAGTPANAPGTLYFEFSTDGVVWDVSRGFSAAGPTSFPPIPLRVVLPKFRVRYVNGATPQTELRITTLLHRTASKSLTRFLNDEITTQEPLENNRSIIAGQRPDGTVVNVPLTALGEVPVRFSQLVPELYDNIALSYTGPNLTQVVYRLGGPAGAIVATVALGYSGNVLVSVGRV